MIFDGAYNGMFFCGRNVRVAKGCDDSLTRLAFGIAIGFDKLDEATAFDGFGAEEHAGASIERGWGEIKIKRCELGTTNDLGKLKIIDFTTISEIQMIL